MYLYGNACTLHKVFLRFIVNVAKGVSKKYAIPYSWGDVLTKGKLG